VNDASKELSADVADFADVRPMVADPPPGVSSCPFRALHLRSLRNPWTTGLVVAGFMLGGDLDYRSRTTDDLQRPEFGRA
jgi:hypothetical protein